MATPGEIAYDTNAGHARLWSILTQMVEHGAEVGYFGIWPLAQVKYADAMAEIGVDVVGERPPAVNLPRPVALKREEPQETRRRFRGAIAEFAPTHVYFYLHYTAEELLDVAQGAAPDAALVLDAVDVLFRQAPDASGEACWAEADELALYERCHAVIVDSCPDAETLRSRELATPVVVAPLTYQPRPGPAWHDRDGVLFVGTSSHPPNADGITWFVRDVLPLVEAALPVSTTIVGRDDENRYAPLARPGVAVTGWRPGVDELLDSHRLSIAPLRNGGGLRGKVLESLSVGLPVVTTDVAAYGIPSPASETTIGGGVPCDPERFAHELVALYSDEGRWARQRDTGLKLIREHFGARRLRDAVAQVLGVEAPS